MSSLIALLALLVAPQPALTPAPQDTSRSITSAAAIPERLLANRARLRLSEGQVARLRSLADRYRFQESQDHLSSKPWLRRAPSLTNARADALRGLSAEQRRLATNVIVSK